jgi:hypothetical protein
MLLLPVDPPPRDPIERSPNASAALMVFSQTR